MHTHLENPSGASFSMNTHGCLKACVHGYFTCQASYLLMLFSRNCLAFLCCDTIYSLYRSIILVMKCRLLNSSEKEV